MKSESDNQLPYSQAVTSAGPQRPWITMVHGASQSSGVFSAQIDAFAERYRLLLLDLPGHGRSSMCDGPYGIVEYTRGVLKALDARGIERTHFWGTHTGAGIALLLASAHPDRIASLVLDGSVLPGVDLPSVTKCIARARATVRARGIEAARKEWFDECEWFEVIRSRPRECRANEHRALIEAFSGRPWLDEARPEPAPSLREKLSGIAQPALIVNGEHDLPDFLAVADELAFRLPNAERLVIPGGGGFPLWEFPDFVNPAVARFLLTASR